MFVITAGFSFDRNLIFALEQEIGQPLAVFEELDSIHTTEEIEEMLSPHIKKGVRCIVIVLNQADTHFLMRITALVTLLSGVLPIMITVHAHWNEQEEVYTLPAYREQPGLGFFER